ncbi:hypothetical protein M427DRAFT_364858 [Gonapodya prolifera JEL478]|uniref:Uncharacterized protein n=1 Tax=Gonapodya prolifera (strain JEL478) TaxID=1344416 RepID=A0A139AA72_GONPJ|nr:hypothetical protein M427DRAFT_364858 [Gonapodya prolifera JEL478]|eukprot:KXS13598.1 hypothetical protein M427DRAFT_364858 [Gonapodya prolifera JEL478]
MDFRHQTIVLGKAAMLTFLDEMSEDDVEELIARKKEEAEQEMRKARERAILHQDAQVKKVT